jgi:cyclopropane-fatty-acyl-phospholipid synthase
MTLDTVREVRVSADPTSATDPAAKRCLSALESLLGPAETWSFAVRLWDHGSFGAGPAQARFTLVLNSPGTLRAMLLPPTRRRLGEAYVLGSADVEGSLEEATVMLRGAVAATLRSPARTARLLQILPMLPKNRWHPRGSGPAPRRGAVLHSKERDAASVRFHYDLSNDFFALWLDARMVYSCAYFQDPSWDLDRAQEAKLDLVCQKLGLEPGQRFLDIGCGWGGLLIHAASKYGVSAVGITLSEQQAHLVRHRIRDAGLDARCEVRVVDYRDLPSIDRFDRIASVGMVEHVGRGALPTYFETVFRLLEPEGLFLNHGIVSLRPALGWWGRRVHRVRRRAASFIERYVFPDTELLTPTEVLGPAERAGFEVRDVENLREHYAHTLREWGSRIEERKADAIRLAGRTTYRVWRLYMAASAGLFARGDLGVHQAVLARRTSEGRAAPVRRTLARHAPIPRRPARG